MAHEFDDYIDRRSTHSYKWDQSLKLFGRDDILPLWVADMDFPSPPGVRRELERRAAHGVYGYTITSQGYIDSIVEWLASKHQWTIRPEWLSHSPGIVTSLSIAVELFSEPEGSVILQSPVYYPFYDVIRMNGRKAAVNPLVIRNGRYEMDYGQLEQLMRDGAKLLLLCSPHNPGGRVWERQELERLSELCLRYGVTVVSDEIHADLALPGHTHIPFASLSDESAAITLTCHAPTKTFNLPGLQSSFTVASNPDIRRKFEYRIKTLSLHMMNYFVPDAVEAAYREGGQWLEDVVQYVQANIDYAIRYLKENLPELKPMPPEAGYLLWLDCRAWNKSAADMKTLMYENARVAFTEGSIFGAEGQGHVRINVACPRATLEQALAQFAAAARSR